MISFRKIWNVVAIAAVAILPLRAQTNPSFVNVTVHDPSVVREGATYYVFGSHMASASTTDLLNWTQISTSAAAPNPLVRNGAPRVEFAEALAYAETDTFWAPDAIKLGDGKFYYYYCACRGDSPLSALGLAKADALNGPYANVGLLLKSGKADSNPAVGTYNVNIHPNVVDPSVFFDQTGKLWMVYGSFSGGIFVLQLEATVGSPTIGQPLPNQGYGKKLIGGNSSRIEGAYITYSPETAYYYLFLTFGGLDAAGGYNIRMGRSRNPDGPFLDAAGNDLTNVKGNFAFDDATIAPYGVKVMGNWQFAHVANEPQTTSRGYVSPGGCSVYRDPAAGKYLLVFHTRFVGRGEQHEVRVHQMFLNADGWFVVAPQRYAQETLSTTVASQIPGDFKLINHGKDVTATVKTSSVITLAANGSIAGASTGTWQLSGDHYANLTLGGVTYRGVFAQVWDDDNQVWVLSFTAVSSDGISVWGSKVAAATIDAAPTISTQPSSQTVAVGGAVTFSIGASGLPPPAYQWMKNGVNIAGATGSTYSISSVAAGDAGNYTVTLTNRAGSVTSSIATLTVGSTSILPAAPTKFGAFASSSTEVTITWQAAASGGAAAGYRIERATDPAFVGGLTTFTLATASTSYVDTSASPGTTYHYRLFATNAVGSSSPTSAMQVQTPASVGTGATHFVNIATRAYCGTGNNVPIGGFVISGSTAKRVLVRAVGPTLTSQGLGQSEVLIDPVVEVHDANRGNVVIATNDNWGDNANAAEITSVSSQIGASALSAGDTKSSALLVSLNPGVYTFVVSGKAGASGIVLLEVYDADLGAGSSTFVNIATRAYSTTGNGVAIGGFVITGAAPKQVLIRAVGPTLSTVGVGSSELLVDPVIELHSGLPLIATNDNWGDNANASAIRTTGARIGAMAFDLADTKSAALLVTLQPGAYSFIAQGKADTSGIVLVEVYDAD